MLKIQGIYSIIHAETGRTYIGSSKDVRKRLGTHRTDLKYNRHPNPALQNYYNKYGKDSFSFNILTIIEDAEILIKSENQEMISHGLANPETNVFDYTKSFNTQWAGKTGCVDPSKYKRGPEHHLYGTVGPNKDKVFSDDVRANMSAGQKGKKVWNEGIPMAEKTKSILSNARKNIPWNAARRKAYEDKSK